MNKEQKREESAAERMRIIGPLLDESLDPAKLQELKLQISQNQGKSVRTLERYLKEYLEKGFEGLKPVIYKQNSNRLPDKFAECLEEAITLRREIPSRSVNQIIRILELEGRIQPGEIKRATLQDHLQDKGFGARQMKIYKAQGLASRTFQKQHRCQLFQADIKYGPHLPIGENRSNKQVYLSVIIDDATRFIIAARFYETLGTEIIEDSLRTGIMHYGKPDALYVDNGKQYRNQWLKLACNKLGIKLIFAKPYSPESKGKVEAFNRTMDSFMAEAAIDKPASLEELNHKLDCWISEYYHKQPHSALGEKAPEIVFKADTRPLKFIPSDTLAKAFLHSETRQVDKTGCVHLSGFLYEAGMKFVGRKVEILFDPMYLEEIEICHDDESPFRVKRLQVGEFCGSRKESDPEKKLETPDSSRLLAALEKQHEKNSAAALPAIKYSDMMQAVSHD